jgi:hypothetical protein
MVASPPAVPPRIYLSYRRQETAFPARWLLDRLARHYGAGHVFGDADPIEPGDDFVEILTSAVLSCDVLLVLIGDEWLTIGDQHGRRRLDDPNDVVRLGIEAALARNVPVIPILVDGARMPRADELPPSLAPLARRQALPLRASRSVLDTNRLLDVLGRTLDEVRAGQPTTEVPDVAAPPAAPPRPYRPPPAPEPLPAPSYRPYRRSRRRWRLWPLRRSQAEAERSTPAEPSEEPAQQRQPEPGDQASFTAGYPGVVTPHVWYSLSVYVHLPGLQAEADRRIAEESRWFGLRPAGSRAAAYGPLPKGTLLRVTPELPGVVVNPPAQEVRWLEDLQQIAFRLQATSEAAGRTVLGAVEVHAGPLLVAQVPLSIHVRGAGEPQERSEPPAASTGRLFGSVFASYAHEDDDVVRAFAEAYRALGIEVLVDKASLRAGQDWEQTLLRLIEEADLFQLFWSEAASRSPYVAEEWRHALSLQGQKGERFIRPLYWTSPWPPPPAQLAHLHFAALDLAAVSSVAGRQ